MSRKRRRRSWGRAGTGATGLATNPSSPAQGGAWFGRRIGCARARGLASKFPSLPTPSRLHRSCDQRLLLSLKNMQGLVSADLDRKRVVVRAGTRIGDIGRALKQIGLSLANQGDIDTQAIAVALSTGTHGTGIGLGCLSSQAVGMRARARAASRQASRRLTKTGPIANAAAFSHSVGRIEPIGRALTNVRSTSTPAVRLLGTNAARRVELTRLKLLSGTVGPGATYAFSLGPLSDASRSFVPPLDRRVSARSRLRSRRQKTVAAGPGIPFSRTEHKDVMVVRDERG